jgi:hypothetical protein
MILFKDKHIAKNVLSRVSKRTNGYVYLEKHTFGFLIAVYKNVNGKLIFNKYHREGTNNENHNPQPPH